MPQPKGCPLNMVVKHHSGFTQKHWRRPKTQNTIQQHRGTWASRNRKGHHKRRGNQNTRTRFTISYLPPDQRRPDLPGEAEPDNKKYQMLPAHHQSFLFRASRSVELHSDAAVFCSDFDLRALLLRSEHVFRRLSGTFLTQWSEV